jgi:predicted aspartyl protease
VKLCGPSGSVNSDFILDTGASHTIIDAHILQSIGYSPRDAVAPSRVSSAAGKEEGYRVRVAAFETLGKRLEDFEVACHALLEQGVEGLVGMTFLQQFDFCIYPARRVIRI